MFTVPRRITLYWLLLLLPTLAVGAGALVLLRREQARLAERAATTEAARRTAVEARVQLVAESAALLVDEVQQGLLATLGGLPTGDLDTALDELERSNPLVRATFRCGPDGRLLRPRAGSEMSPEGADFQRRFSRLLATQPPWSVSASMKDEPAAKAATLEAEASPAQQRAVSNIAQVQSAREEARQVSKIARASSSHGADSAAAPSASRERMDTDFREKDEAPALAAAAGFSRGDRSGWAPLTSGGRLSVLGWLQPGGLGEVRGVELELTALVARLAAVLPAEAGAGERYALLDAGGRVLHEVGGGRFSNGAAPAVRLALSAALPQWEVAGWTDAGIYGSDDPQTWYTAAAALVALLVLAILAGGSLLLWQARRSEAEAAQKTSFVANVSHEFKTPLTTIRLYSELLAQGRVREAAKQADYLQTIGRETQRLARLVNNVLDFSRLEQGRKKYQREELDLTAVLGALLDAHAPRIAEAGLVLARALPAAPLRATTDRDALEQIVLNLLDNACKYAAAGGEVKVEATTRMGGGVEVRVLDRGPGVPPAQRDRIFEKFHRVDDALTAEKGGAGLGLSIARQLARGLGGEVNYEPRVGGGAVFVLTLP